VAQEWQQQDGLVLFGGSGRFKMLSTSEGSRALGCMGAFMGVELRLSGAGEIGISFLGCACVCACGGGGAVVGCFR
jgi:hypothetical protein